MVLWLTVAFAGWDVENRGVGFRPDLHVDPGGTVQLAYSESGVWLSEQGPGGWTTEFVAQGDAPQIDVSPTGVVSVVHHDNSGVHFSERIGGVWQTAQVSPEGSQREPSLSFLPSGEPVVALHMWGDHSLVLATRTAGSWVSETVDASGDVGQYVDVEVGLDGRIVLAYWSDDGAGGSLKVASFDGAWGITTVSGAVRSIDGVALELGTDGLARVAFFDAQGAPSLASEDPGGGWQVDAITAAGFDNPHGIDLDLDSSGRASVFFGAGGTPDPWCWADLQETWLAEETSAGWLLTGMGHGVGDNGIAMALDNNDQPVAAWNDRFAQDLMVGWSNLDRLVLTVSPRNPILPRGQVAVVDVTVRNEGPTGVAFDRLFLNVSGHCRNPAAFPGTDVTWWYGPPVVLPPGTERSTTARLRIPRNGVPANWYTLGFGLDLGMTQAARGWSVVEVQ